MDICALATDVTDLRAFARELGRDCLAREAQIKELREKNKGAEALARALELSLAALGDDFWADAVEGTRSFADALSDPDVAAVLELAQAEPQLVSWLGLRGLCATGLRYLFSITRDAFVLEHGDPYPLVDPPKGALVLHPTPRTTTTLIYGELLWETGFTLHEGEAGAAVTVTLDYSRRAVLDELVWGSPDAARLPRCGSVHPYDRFDGLYELGVYDDFWFDVRPTAFDREAVLAALAELGDAVDIAVLPELSLAEPGALAQALLEAPETFPALVATGSAHARLDVDGSERRVNVAELYWEGAEIVRHHKTHPMRYRVDGRDLPEGLTGEQKTVRLLCGGETRLALLICADLNDRRLVTKLVAAGVNVLIVPALTPHEGAFEGGASALASYCQGVALVVNGSPPGGNEGDDEPFMLMFSTPRRAQPVRTVGPENGRQASSVIDLAAGSVRWLPWQ